MPMVFNHCDCGVVCYSSYPDTPLGIRMSLSVLENNSQSLNLGHLTTHQTNQTFQGTGKGD